MRIQHELADCFHDFKNYAKHVKGDVASSAVIVIFADVQ